MPPFEPEQGFLPLSAFADREKPNIKNATNEKAVNFFIATPIAISSPLLTIATTNKPPEGG
ncbi:hypothetical protein XU56_003258 [Escherichia coli]|nr:hypothetical protein [Escherichia coli]PGG42535.1 hypothetical protein BMR13_28545 [Escherichia coli]